MSEDLVDKAKRRLYRHTDLTFQGSEALYCTMMCKHIPGPDWNYEQQFFKQKCSELILTELYWNEQGECGAAVKLSEEDKKLYRQQTIQPYVSISTTTHSNYQSIGDLVTTGVSHTNWKLVDPSNKIYDHSACQLHKQTLNWKTKGLKEVHVQPKQEKIE